MLSFLKQHPFAVEAFFESSLVVTFAIPKEELQNRIPECLTLDTFEDKWAFIAVAMVQTTGFRPKGFPSLFGNDFFLIGYRIFVRYLSNTGKRLRGLYILKSETDKKKMEWLGNIFTQYSYTTTDIAINKTENSMQIKSIQSDLLINLEEGDAEIALPLNSPFSDWKTARKYAGPLPFTFSYNTTTKKILIIEGVRQNWIPKPVAVKDYKIEFIESLQLKNVVLANAFVIHDIQYYWKKGKTEQWNQEESHFRES
jgi:uncharacterized protein YqjF (DUF2071 family)